MIRLLGIILFYIMEEFMEIEEKIIEIKKEIGKLVSKKIEIDNTLQELTHEIEEKRKELIDLEIKNRENIMESRKVL